MFNILMQMWINHKITDEKLRKAVEKNWISQEQCDTILAMNQAE